MTANRRITIFLGILILAAVGGGLTSLIAAEGWNGIVPVLTVTDRPEASVNAFGGNQGLWFFLMVGFIVFNLVGASLTGALIFWFLNREVERAKSEEPANHETFFEALPKLPGRNQDTNISGELPSGVEPS